MNTERLLIILFLFCIISYIKEKNILNPCFIFNFIWLITLSLYELKLSHIQQDLSDRTIFIFWVCVLCFNITIFLLELVKFPMFRQKILKKNYAKRRYFAKYVVLWIFLLEIIYSGGFPLIWKIFGINKTYFDFGIPSLHGAWCGLVVCLGAYSLFRKTKDKWLYLGICSIVISRQIMMSIIIEGFIYALYVKNIRIRNEKFDSRKRIKGKFIIFLFAIIIFVFTLIGNFRSGSAVMDRVFRAKQEYVLLSSSSKWIYSYMTFSISNFNNLVSMTQGSINNGASMLRAFLPTVVLRIFRIKPNFSYRYIVSKNYTVSTYLPDIYLDFGITGIGIFNIIMGLVGYILYKNIKKAKTTRRILLYSVYAHNIILLFFTNFFLYLPIIIQMFYIPILFINDNEK